MRIPLCPTPWLGPRAGGRVRLHLRKRPPSPGRRRWRNKHVGEPIASAGARALGALSATTPPTSATACVTTTATTRWRPVAARGHDASPGRADHREEALEREGRERARGERERGRHAASARPPARASVSVRRCCAAAAAPTQSRRGPWRRRSRRRVSGGRARATRCTRPLDDGERTRRRHRAR